MLVLARRQTERIMVPAINMVIEVVRIGHDSVRLGIEAPHDIVILREEVENTEESVPLQEQLAEQRQQKHELRNQLHGARLGVNLLNKMIEKGADLEQIKDTIWRIESGFAEKSEVEVKPAKISALLVEDRDNEREMLASILKMSGYDVISANSGENALRYLTQTRTMPDVLLLDMGLPNMDGEDVLKIVRGNHSMDAMKVFVISGRERQDNVRADKWFRKPLDPSMLIENLESLQKLQKVG